MKFFQFAVAGLCLMLFTAARPAEAKVDVMAANQDLAWVAKTIGGKNVSVDYLASSKQDPHLIDPRPSQVVRLSRTDLVVRIGLDLDLWLDSLIRAAGNSKILQGAPGYVDCSRGIQLLQIPQGKLDPSRGDLHIYGNPHYFFGPSNLRIVARNVTDGLKRVDGKNAASYEANYNGLVARLKEAQAKWKARLAGEKGKAVVVYHQSLIYFLTEFGIREYAQVEPRPGLEPTPGHISSVAKAMKADGVKVILTENFRPRRFANLLSRQSGAQVVVVPGGIGAEKGLDDYFTFMDALVERVAAAL